VPILAFKNFPAACLAQITLWGTSRLVNVTVQESCEVHAFSIELELLLPSAYVKDEERKLNVAFIDEC
jgi:hypothetical protein